MSSRYLFLGGPLHGQVQPVDDGVNVIEGLYKPPSRLEGGAVILGGAAEKHVYGRQTMNANIQNAEGTTVIGREVFVHAGLNMEVAFNLLAQWTMLDFLDKGLRVVPEEPEELEELPKLQIPGA